MNFIIDIPWYVRNWFIKNCVIRTQIKKIYYYILFLNKFTNDSLFCWYKVQFKYAHKFVFKSNYKVINNVLIIQLLILKKIFKKFNYLTINLTKNTEYFFSNKDISPNSIIFWQIRK